MRLGTIRDGSRDGTLVVVRADGTAYIPAPPAFPTLQAALDRWDEAQPALALWPAVSIAASLPGTAIDPATPLAAPLPRAYEWLDGSAFLTTCGWPGARAAPSSPPELVTDPLVYQGGSGVLLGPRDPLPFADPALGLDFEAEIGVILGDVPRGIDAAAAGRQIRLVCLLNDVTLRNLVPARAGQGLRLRAVETGHRVRPVRGHPRRAGRRLARRAGCTCACACRLNGSVVGDCDAGEMHFSFPS